MHIQSRNDSENIIWISPEESDPFYNFALSNLEAKKIELNNRYPPVCKLCQKNVDNTLSFNNSVVKGDLNSFFLRKEEHPENIKNANATLYSILSGLADIFTLGCVPFSIFGNMIWIHDENTKNERFHRSIIRLFSVATLFLLIASHSRKDGGLPKSFMLRVIYLIGLNSSKGFYSFYPVNGTLSILLSTY